MFVAEDAVALRRAFAETSVHGLEMIVTEIIPGPESAYCSMFTYLDETGEPLFLYTKRKLRQYPPGFGVGCYHVTSGIRPSPRWACACCGRPTFPASPTSSSSATRATARSS